MSHHHESVLYVVAVVVLVVCCIIETPHNDIHTTINNNKKKRAFITKGRKFRHDRVLGKSGEVLLQILQNMDGGQQTGKDISVVKSYYNCGRADKIMMRVKDIKIKWSIFIKRSATKSCMVLDLKGSFSNSLHQLNVQLKKPLCKIEVNIKEVFIRYKHWKLFYDTACLQVFCNQVC